MQRLPHCDNLPVLAHVVEVGIPMAYFGYGLLALHAHIICFIYICIYAAARSNSCAVFESPAVALLLARNSRLRSADRSSACW